MRIKDFMSTNLEYVSMKDNMYEVACLMRDHNVGLIPVVDQGRLIGVVTDRDLVVRGIAERRPNSLEVGKVMSSVLVKGHPDMTVEEASKRMAEAQVRRIPIVDQDDRLIGMVSLGDIAVRNPMKNEVSEVLGEISETHNPKTSNDIQSSTIH